MTSFEHWNNPSNIKSLIERLVNIPSVSGTLGEVMMSGSIHEIINEIPFFQQNPHLVMDCPLENDALSRSSVVALYKGSGKSSSKKTVILLSHYDVVGVDDFGHLISYAFQPEAYTEKLRNEIYNSLDKEAKKDLDSEEWLFARGIMDMKAGLAMQLAVLSELTLQEDFDGNILLVTTPDEETNSEGMFSVIPVLNQLKKEHDLDYQLCICSEPSFASYPKDDGKHIYTGSVGKLLPLIYCNGRETHVGESLDGVNAGWMAAELVSQLELSEEFVDSVADEKSPPPTSLKTTDLKEHYNVQTPSAAYVLYNILTMTQTSSMVLKKLKKLSDEAAHTIFSRIKNKYENYQIKSTNIEQYRPKVYTYEELYEKGKEMHGNSFVDAIQSVIHEPEQDSRDLTMKVAAKMTTFFNHEVFYLIMFAPPFYPHTYLDEETDTSTKSVVNKIVHEGKRQFNEDIKVKKYFTGLSDVSYCRIQDTESVTALKKNMPLLGNHYQIPIDDMIELNVPIINLGPYGKDPHKRTERLHMHFSTAIAPQLLKIGIEHILSKGES